MQLLLVLTSTLMLVLPSIAQSSCECKSGVTGDDDTCSPRCEELEVWACANPNVGCTDSCTDRLRNLSTCSKKTSCYAMTCVCLDGYARDSSYNCVPLKKCPGSIQCPQNEFYSTCKSPCFHDSCGRKDLFLRNETCNDSCLGDAGCTCEIGFARHPSTHKCIKASECPTGCPTNEIYSCKDACLDESCAAGVKFGAPQLKKNCSSKAACEWGCNCKPNYYRNPYVNNQCVCLSECALQGSKHSRSRSPVPPGE